MAKQEVQRQPPVLLRSILDNREYLYTAETLIPTKFTDLI
jgi:hypothetical protein